MSEADYQGLSAEQLQEHGLMLADEGKLIFGKLRFERPGYLYGHRMKDCTVGAFTYFNAAGNISCYRTHFGRYSEVGESAIVGPPEHPQDWFSSHPFAFTRPRYMPNIYKLPDFQRLGPDEKPGPSYVDGVPSETWIGHEAYISVNSFVRRGVRVGDGAVVGANSVVTKDVPPYAIVAGAPARMIKLRFPEKIVERFLALQWWRYDLAPFKNEVDFSKVEATLDFFEERKADGRLQDLRPDTYSLERKPGGFELTRLPQTLYFPHS